MKRLWKRFGKREKGYIALTIIISSLVLGRYLLISPILERREWIKSQLETKTQLLERDLRYMSQKEIVETALNRERGTLSALESLLLSGDTPSVSASDLQNLLGNISAKDGGQIITMRVLNAEKMGPYMRVPVQLEINGEIGQIASLIKGIQSAEKLLIVNELNVRPVFTPYPATRPKEGRALAGQNLHVGLIVSGFTRIQSAASMSSGPISNNIRSKEG